MASMYGVFHGPIGLKEIAKKIHGLAVLLENALNKIGIKQLNENYFDTLLLEGSSEKIRLIAEKNKINFNYISDKLFSISLNETTSLNDIQLIINLISKATYKETIIADVSTGSIRISTSFLRESSFLQANIFNSHHSETGLMRYIKNLERKDLSLTHSMISLGSCTMKLNAASEMIPISWSKWNNIHPFAPLSQAKGYKKLLKKLENQLNVITGFAGTSLQPNSGAQGEYAGLMVIRAYLKRRRPS